MSFYIGYGPDAGIDWDYISEFLTHDEKELLREVRSESKKYWDVAHAVFLLLERVSNVRRHYEEQVFSLAEALTAEDLKMLWYRAEEIVDASKPCAIQ